MTCLKCLVRAAWFALGVIDFAFVSFVIVYFDNIHDLIYFSYVFNKP